MKTMKKMMVLVLSIMMVLGTTVVTSFAANGTITITPPTGSTGTNTYPIYKVFDAVYDAESEGISYSVMSGKTGMEILQLILLKALAPQSYMVFV